MKEFLNLIKNSYFVLLFLILESFSVFLIVKNTGKEGIFINSANYFAGSIHEKIRNISAYFSLREENKKLAEANKKLRNYISITQTDKPRYSPEIQQYGYFYKSAEVVKNSTDKEHNILTVNKGSKDGINTNSAVVSDNGVVGITAIIGKHFTTVVSLLNTKLEISAKIKRTDFHGIAKWDGKDYRYITLYDIPVYSSLFKGDEVVTGGYSAIFPEGIKIGTVYSFEKDKQNTFYNIKVKLGQDFKKLDFVYIIDCKSKEERRQLEDSTLNLYGF
ncbi:MAG: rod shape-determining protein MreC [Chlorobi bacterium]|nr:rod shape-determining protein MreC [Chlorobiota bacterium]